MIDLHLDFWIIFINFLYKNFTNLYTYQLCMIILYFYSVSFMVYIWMSPHESLRVSKVGLFEKWLNHDVIPASWWLYSYIDIGKRMFLGVGSGNVYISLPLLILILFLLCHSLLPCHPAFELADHGVKPLQAMSQIKLLLL